MPAVVQRLILKRFRSVPSGRIDFDNPTFLVGRNGSGKSNIADALAFLSESMIVPLPGVFARRGGISVVRNRTAGRSFPPNLGLAVECGTIDQLRELGIRGDIESARYAFEIKALADYRFEVLREQVIVRWKDGTKEWFDRRKGGIQSNVEPLQGSQTTQFFDPSALALPVFAGLHPFGSIHQVLRLMRVYSIDPSKLREMQDPEAGDSLKPDGSNATSVLQEIQRRSPHSIERIGELLSSIVPKTARVRTVQHGKKLALQFTQQWAEKKKLDFESFNMSDGTLRGFGLLLAIFQKDSPSLIVVEEPEASIHPGAAGTILDLLRAATRQMQVVVSTHSPEILDAKWIEERHLRVIEWKEGATQILPISEVSRKALNAHLMGAGELLRSGVLEPEEPQLPAPVDVQTNLFEEL
jgi:predicted ATPase